MYLFTKERHRDIFKTNLQMANVFTKRRRNKNKFTANNDAEETLSFLLKTKDMS